MKYIAAIIKPFKLEDIREALAELDVRGIMVTEVRGFGRQLGYSEIYRGSARVMEFLPKLKLEMAIADQQLDAVLDVLSLHAKTGQVGDGKVFIRSMDQAIRIRTGEAGDIAL